VSLRTEYGTTLCDSLVVESYRETLPYRVRRLTHPPGSQGTWSVPARPSSLKGEPRSIAKTCHKKARGHSWLERNVERSRSPIVPDGRVLPGTKKRGPGLGPLFQVD
jgi:hypothetical protein